MCSSLIWSCLCLDGIVRVPKNVLHKANADLQSLRMSVFKLLQPKLHCQLGKCRLLKISQIKMNSVWEIRDDFRHSYFVCVPIDPQVTQCNSRLLKYRCRFSHSLTTLYKFRLMAEYWYQDCSEINVNSFRNSF